MKKILRWTCRIIGVVLLIFIMQLTVLAYPYFLFSEKYDDGSITFYSDKKLSDDKIADLMTIRSRLEILDMYDPNHETDVLLCHDQSLYMFFARLTFVGKEIPGYNLSVFENSFISIPRLNEINQSGWGAPKYSVFDGELLHCITHEMIHDYTVEKYGFFDNRNIPRWKREGHAEFSADRLILPADSSETLYDRVLMLKTAYGWTDHVIEYYSWRTVTEYLFEVEHMTFDGYISAEVNFDDSFIAMNKWFDEQPDN